MSTNTSKTADGGDLMQNDYIQELLSILQDNGRDTAGMTTLIRHVTEMEDFVKLAEARIADMKAQLDTMKEIQDHPVKNKLNNLIKAMEAKLPEIKAHIIELKNNIIDGCKKAVAAAKEKGITVLDKLASFFRIKKALQAVKYDAVATVAFCDKAVASINAFAEEYHKSGRALKNMARMAVGKEPLVRAKEPGKLSRIISAPYRSSKACWVGIRKAVNSMIRKLEELETNAEAIRAERAAAKKPSLTERLDSKKEEVKKRDLETPKPERATRAAGLEV